MNQTTIKQLAIGFVLALLGVTLFFVQKNDNTTSAQGGGSYSSNWRAQKLIKVDAQWNNAALRRGPAIGIAEWRVTGTVGSKTFTETWTAPSANGVVITNTGPNTCTTNLGANASKWLYGCAVSNSGLGGADVARYNFSVVDSATFNTGSLDSWSGGLGSNGMDADGIAAGCWKSQQTDNEPDCLVTSGAYSFQHHHFPGFGGDNDRDRILGFGTLMPLEWTVSGTFN